MRNFARNFAIMAAASAALLGQTEQSRAHPRFIGKMIFTAQAGTCNNLGPLGKRPRARFIPAGVGNNGPDSSLSVFGFGLDGSDSEWAGLGATLVGGSFDTTLRAVRAYDITLGARARAGVSVRFATQSPATILTTTNVVDVTGTAKNWVGGPLCVVTFRLSAVRELK